MRLMEGLLCELGAVPLARVLLINMFKLGWLSSKVMMANVARERQCGRE